MNAGQNQFVDLIMERTQETQKEAMQALLEEGFAKQANGTFTPEYLAGYTPKMLDMLKPEYVAEVREITEKFGQARTN